MKCDASGYNSKQGKCCCNCKSQLTVYKHPWNLNPYAKGKISKVMGYGCNTLYDKFVFLDRQHSLCELHEFRE